MIMIAKFNNVFERYLEEKTFSNDIKIGVFGKTGSGKSTLCNTIAGKKVAETSDVAACTYEAQEIPIKIGDKTLTLVDVPGAGESCLKDETYGKLYEEVVKDLDCLLWLIKADDRALKIDEDFYNTVAKPLMNAGIPVLIVLSQVDKIQPYRDWNSSRNTLGLAQKENVAKKKTAIKEALGHNKKSIIPVSATEEYNIKKLLTEIIKILPEKRIESHKKSASSYSSTSSGDPVLDVLDSVGDAVEGFFEIVEDFFDIFRQ